MNIVLPKCAVLELTYRCNHKCKFCSCPWYAPNSSYPVGDELDLSQWKQVIKRLYDSGIEAISISGGECLLKDCLPDILQFINEESQKRNLHKEIVLISNGLLMSHDYLKLFKQYHVHLSMSLPGVETFEEHTGVNNASGVLRWFQEAKAIGLKTTVNITVTQRNYHELFWTISLGLINGASSILLNRFLPGGRGLIYKEELALSSTQLNGMLDTAEEVLTLSNRYGHVGTEIPLCALPWLSLPGNCCAPMMTVSLPFSLLMRSTTVSRAFIFWNLSASKSRKLVCIPPLPSMLITTTPARLYWYPERYNLVRHSLAF